MVAMPTTHTIHDNLADHGYALVPASAVTPLQEFPAEWLTLAAEIPHLPADESLPDGEHFRFRRDDTFIFEPMTGDLTLQPSDAKSALTSEIAANSFLHALIRWDFAQLPIYDRTWRQGKWQVGVHIVNTVANPGEPEHPSPEHIHRHGGAFTAVHLAALDNADGGFVTIYDDLQQPLECFRLNHIMHSYLFNDASLWHGVTAIRPREEDTPAFRTILRIDFFFLS